MSRLSQVEVEQIMYHGGIKRAETMMARAEEAGRAHQNPYAKQVMRDFVLPISAAIKADLEKVTAHRQAAHVALLRPLDPDAVAFLAVRCALNACMSPEQLRGRTADERNVAGRIGSTVNSELVLAQLEQHNPELYHTIANDLARRLSKDERHRMTVFKLQAKKNGIEWVEWPVGAKEQVGSYLLGLLVQAGMIEMPADRALLKGKQEVRPVWLSETTTASIDKIKGFCAITSPTYGPCVEQPRDWTTPTDGGFHTRELRRTLPMVVRCHPTARPRVRDSEMPIVLNCVNMLQRTAWAVNPRLLAAVYDLSKAGVATDEIVALSASPRPARPENLPDTKADEMDPADRARFTAWKREVTEWHTAKKLLGVKYGRFHAATRAAEMFKDYPALHFVYFADSRGRFYPLTYGINPQGSDLQKALLQFSVGKPLDTYEAVRWFHIQGANKYGFDKATLSERFMWVHERQDILLSFADDPVNNRGWLEAGDPMQFLAWCFEYAEFTRDPKNFKSHLPISMDGSCNGLQNLSAMLRDEVGGKATNLTDNEVMEDIYRTVAEAAMLRLRETVYEEADKEELRVKWIEHGVSRSVVKRSVMTTPYGVTRSTATEYVILDYLAGGKTPFIKSEFRRAATVLMAAVWPAIGDVVVKGTICMAWLKKGGRTIVKNLPEGVEPLIEWTSPSGFPASQAYFEMESHRISTRLAGTETIKIRVPSELEEPDRAAHSSGLAPNFVHSMDAAHLHRVASRCFLTLGTSAPIDAVAMIHDDYGTHAADAQRLYEMIREEFVAMYLEHDPVMEFYNKYPCVGVPPEKGSLDITEVLKSDFFFS